MFVCVPCACLVSRHGFSVTDVSECSYGNWEPNSFPLEGQPILLTTEQSLKYIIPFPVNILYYINILKIPTISNLEEQNICKCSKALILLQI